MEILCDGAARIARRLSLHSQGIFNGRSIVSRLGHHHLRVFRAFGDHDLGIASGFRLGGVDRLFDA
jgi:hypothetical protein